jgi:hypothetical protein
MRFRSPRRTSLGADQRHTKVRDLRSHWDLVMIDPRVLNRSTSASEMVVDLCISSGPGKGVSQVRVRAGSKTGRVEYHHLICETTRTARRLGAADSWTVVKCSVAR